MPTPILSDFVGNHNSWADKLSNAKAVANLVKRSFFDSSSSNIPINNPNHVPQPDGNNIAMYFLPATWAGNGSNLPVVNYLQDKLPEEISKMVLVAPVGDFRGTIEDMALQLAKDMKEAGDKKVILEGYSRGKLVIEEFALTLAKKNDISVEGLIGICGPGKGTTLTNSCLSNFSPSFAAMNPESEFMENLQRKRIPENITYPQYLYAGADDEFVTPDSAFNGYQQFYPVTVDTLDTPTGPVIIEPTARLARSYDKNARVKLGLFAGNHSEVIENPKLAQAILEDVKEIASQSHRNKR